MDSHTGKLAAGLAADFFTVDLLDPSIAGNRPDELLGSIVFGLPKAAVREVAANGRLIVEDGRHPSQDEIVQDYCALMQRQEANACAM